VWIGDLSYLRCWEGVLYFSFVIDVFSRKVIGWQLWRSRSQLELATVEYLGWFNHNRLHEALGDIPPVEFEPLHAAREPLIGPIPGHGPVAALSPRALDGLIVRQLEPIGVDFVVDRLTQPHDASDLPALFAPAAIEAVEGPAAPTGLSDP
jgi:Integrase core domain